MIFMRLNILLEELVNATNCTVVINSVYVHMAVHLYRF